MKHNESLSFLSGQQFSIFNIWSWTSTNSHRNFKTFVSNFCLRVNDKGFFYDCVEQVLDLFRNTFVCPNNITNLCVLDPCPHQICSFYHELFHSSLSHYPIIAQLRLLKEKIHCRVEYLLASLMFHLNQNWDVLVEDNVVF